MVSGIESSIWSYKTLSLDYLQCTSVLALMSHKAHLKHSYWVYRMHPPQETVMLPKADILSAMPKITSNP